MRECSWDIFLGPPSFFLPVNVNSSLIRLNHNGREDTKGWMTFCCFYWKITLLKACLAFGQSETVFVCLEINTWAPHFSLLCPPPLFMTQKRTPQNMQRNYKKSWRCKGGAAAYGSLWKCPHHIPSVMLAAGPFASPVTAVMWGWKWLSCGLTRGDW